MHDLCLPIVMKVRTSILYCTWMHTETYLEVMTESSFLHVIPQPKHFEFGIALQWKPELCMFLKCGHAHCSGHSLKLKCLLIS